MVKALVEEALLWVISAIVNLILFSLLTVAFIVRVQEVPEIYPLKVQIKQIEVKEEPKPKSVLKATAVAKRTEAPPKPKAKIAKKRQAGATLTTAHEKGDVKVPVQEEEDVSVLAELQKKIESRLKERRREVPKKEVGTLSAVVTAKEVKIRGGTRKIIYTPPPPELVTTEFPSSVRIRIWVSPEGRVVRAILIRRSGNVNIDSALLSYVRKIRFEKVEYAEVQIGEIAFSFRGG